MKKRILAFILSILLIILSVSSFGGCEQKEKYTIERFDYFDTFSTFTSYCDRQQFIFYTTEFDSILIQYHQLFDIYNSYEGTVNLKILNEQAALSPVAVSEELFDALTLAKELYTVTNGKFNVAIGALTSIWHDAREHSTNHPESAYIPSAEQISKALLHTDINSLILNEEERTVFYSDPKLLLDFGAIAKGYVTSALYERFTELGLDNFLINLGGNVASHGTKPQNEPWIIEIENPLKDKSLGYNNAIKLNNMTVVTSGSYQRNFIYNEKEYSHIIEALSGYPADIFTSVSIQAPSSSSALADALSTALFCMSYEEGLSIIEKLDGVEALWIFKDGSFKATSEFGGAK